MMLWSSLAEEMRGEKFMPDMPTSKFMKVRCKKCRNEQIIFNKAAITVKCLVCDSVLAEPTGGIARINEKVVESVELVDS